MSVPHPEHDRADRDDLGHSAPSLTLVDLARRMAPELDVLSVSEPEPRLAARNVVGVCRDGDVARRAVLALERIDDDDAHVGLAVLGRAGAADPTDHPQADPEGVSKKVGGRALIGGAVGAVVGAVLFGAVMAFIDPDLWIGAAIGGAVLIGGFGAIWTAFSGMGGSDAYRQSFVDPDTSTLGLVMIPAVNADVARAARQELEGVDGLEIWDVDAVGERLDGAR